MMRVCCTCNCIVKRFRVVVLLKRTRGSSPVSVSCGTRKISASTMFILEVLMSVFTSDSELEILYLLYIRNTSTATTAEQTCSERSYDVLSTGDTTLLTRM